MDINKFTQKRFPITINITYITLTHTALFFLGPVKKSPASYPFKIRVGQSPGEDKINKEVIDLKMLSKLTLFGNHLPPNSKHLTLLMP